MRQLVIQETTSHRSLQFTCGAKQASNVYLIHDVTFVLHEVIGEIIIFNLF